MVVLAKASGNHSHPSKKSGNRGRGLPHNEWIFLHTRLPTKSIRIDFRFLLSIFFLANIADLHCLYVSLQYTIDFLWCCMCWIVAVFTNDMGEKLKTYQGGHEANSSPRVMVRRLRISTWLWVPPEPACIRDYPLKTRYSKTSTRLWVNLRAIICLPWAKSMHAGPG